METKQLLFTTVNGMAIWRGRTELHAFIGLMRESAEKLQAALEKEFPSFRVVLVG